MEPEGSLPCPQEAANGPCLGPDESSPQSTSSHSVMYNHFDIILPYPPKFPKWSLSFRSSCQNFVCTSYLPVSAACPASFILINLITLIIYMVKSINYKDSHYETFSILLLSALSSVKISSSGLWFETQCIFFPKGQR
jgi:hypothetical protein